MSLISVAHASESVESVAPMSTGTSLMSLLPMVLIFAIFYFFLIRPQVKKQKAVENMVGNLKKGDRVVAAGGLYGSIHKIEGNVIYLEISENVRIKALKSSVTEMLSKDDNPVVEEKVEKEKSKAKSAEKKTAKIETKKLVKKTTKPKTTKTKKD
ncbi:MAG: preprotein translocase subunit YajC [Rickettsiales bacterium]|nr:preprotein translocase subunit YajC [Rickettsiales bacterium]